MKCSELKVHNDKMEDSNREKYLGDILDKTGKIKGTVEERQRRGYGLVAEILAILAEIPLGKYKMEIGLHLRQGMLLNGMLFNSEVWHGISDEEINMLEKVDEHLLRSLVNGHSKTSKEFLYLEAGAVPIRFIISSRRILFLQTIVHRSNEELSKRVYEAQKTNTVKGDFYELVLKDMQMIGDGITEEYIKSCSKGALKRQLKEKTRNVALKYLKQKQKEHSKIKDIEYTKLETQEYMKSPIFTNAEVNFLNALRSRSINVKWNFKSKYSNNLQCPLCELSKDDQSHLLECPELRKRFKTNEVCQKPCKYEDIFSDHQKQKEVTHQIMKLMNIREQMVNKNLQLVSDPSTPGGVLDNSDNLPVGIDYYYLGS